MRAGNNHYVAVWLAGSSLDQILKPSSSFQVPTNSSPCNMDKRPNLPLESTVLQFAREIAQNE